MEGIKDAGELLREVAANGPKGSQEVREMHSAMQLAINKLAIACTRSLLGEITDAQFDIEAHRFQAQALDAERKAREIVARGGIRG